jgi:deoxycytidine triphosphate deaminase
MSSNNCSIPLLTSDQVASGNILTLENLLRTIQELQNQLNSLPKSLSLKIRKEYVLYVGSELPHLLEKYKALPPKRAEDAGFDLLIGGDINIPPSTYATEAHTINHLINCEMRKIYHLPPMEKDLSKYFNPVPKTYDSTTSSYFQCVSYYLYPRSSLSKTPLILANGTGIIDSGYRGHIMAKVHNLKSNLVCLNEGDKYFQLCAPGLKPFTVQFVSRVTLLTESERGTGGFGSTDTKK